MSKSPVFLDLDAVAAERPEVSLKLKGKSHALKYASVESFVQNTKLLQTMSATGDIEEETTLIIKVIMTSFPTLKEKDLWDLGLDQLNAIMNFARTHNGEKDSEAEMEGAAVEQENPPTEA